jgi:hypothetical protein
MHIQKCTCNAHHAHSDKFLKHKNLDRSGLGGTACGRHGCFCPCALVDFQLGERQLNMDYSLSQALRHSGLLSTQQLIVMYDIMCQYYKKMQQRFQASPWLSLPDDMTMHKGVGSWHVGAHIPTCFPRFSPTYIPGAGQLAGEILESLWSVLNRISPSTQTATLCARSEMLDDHMNDSNLKKMMGIGQ